MTPPRRILPGKVWSIARTCSRRSFSLRPDSVVNQVVKYCVGAAAKRTGARLLSLCTMSSHLHVEVEDVHGNLPDFMAYMDRLIAMCLKEHFDIDENFWSTASYDPVELVTEEAIFERAAYCITNPIAAGLVHSWKKWPGVVSRPDACLRAPEIVERPRVFFSEKGTMPEQVELTFSRPSALSHLTEAEYAKRLSRAVDTRERELRAEMRRQGRSFKGARAVLRQSPATRPTTKRGGGINPRVAGRNTADRIGALDALRLFHDAYRAAWEEMKQGAKDVLFPAGTWRLRVHYAVRCHPFPA